MKVALIPAAGRGTRMMSLTDYYPKAMMPYNNYPIIGYQIEKIKDEFDTIIIVTGYKQEKIIDFVNNNYKNLDIRFITQYKLDGLASAIKLGLSLLSTNELSDSSVYVELSDVLIKNKNLNKDTLLVSHVKDWSRWCLVEVDKDNNIIGFFDKPKDKPRTDMNIIGGYNFGAANLLMKSINKIIANDKKIHNEFQLSSAIEEYIKVKPMKVQEVDEYLDLGEVDKFNNISKNISRSFNNIAIDEDDNVVKTSENIKKVKDEFNWFNNVQQTKLSNYLPKVYKELDDGYVMQRVSSNQIQDMMMFQHLNYDEWENIIGEIENFLSFAWLNAKEYSDNNLKADNKKMLIDKTLERTSTLKELFPYKTYVINGVIYKNPLYYIDIILEHVKEINKNPEQYNTLLHGDLFFGNMMYDKVFNQLKLIDPRGSYGDSDIYGDIRYDVAKLNHSINGKYDFIVNDLFTLSSHHSIINYNIYEGDHNDLRFLFQSMISRLKLRDDDINLITGLLFLTMIPIHNDNLNHQTMQFAKACEFLSDFI